MAPCVGVCAIVAPRAVERGRTPSAGAGRSPASRECHHAESDLRRRQTKGPAWDPDAMILNARSLQATARQLASDPDPCENEPTPDAFHYNGRFLAGPILLALATEIALKAWQCRERAGAPDRSHDLVVLFEELSEEARDVLVAHCPKDVISARLGSVRPDPFRNAQDAGDPQGHVPALALCVRGHARSHLARCARRHADRDHGGVRASAAQRSWVG